MHAEKVPRPKLILGQFPRHQRRVRTPQHPITSTKLRLALRLVARSLRPNFFYPRGEERSRAPLFGGIDARDRRVLTQRAKQGARRVAGVEGTTTDEDAAFPRGFVPRSCADGAAEAEEVEGEEAASSGGTTRTASRRNTLAPRSSSSPRAAAPCTRACATCASSLRACASRTLSGMVSRRLVRRSGGRDDCKRVRSVCALSDCA